MRHGDFHKFGMHSIAVLALIAQHYLQPVDGACFVATPSVIGTPSYAISGLPRNGDIVSNGTIKMKPESDAEERCEPAERKHTHSHFPNRKRSIHPASSTVMGGGPSDSEYLENLPLPSSSSSSSSLNRRRVLQSASYLSLTRPLLHPTSARASEQRVEAEEAAARPIPRGEVFEIEDPDSYSAAVYVPPARKVRKDEAAAVVEGAETYPLLVVLHGAGNNRNSALEEFAREGGDHANLPPYLLSTGRAPSSLSENFVVVAPYVGRGKRSLYDEPRSRILSFVRWFNDWIESQTTLKEDGATTANVAIDRKRVSLFGFSEGSTLAVELATTRRFDGVVACSYGFSGTLPKMAVDRLRGIPIWVFHSKGDDVYDVGCSNGLVESLVTNEGIGGLDAFDAGNNVVKYTKLIPSPGDGGKGKGFEHVRAALVASKDGEVYSWLLSLR